MLNNEKIVKYLNTFNFPRLSGTEGEKKAVKLTKEIFKEIGFNKINTESFHFSTFYSIISLKLIIALSLGLLLCLMLLIYYLFCIPIIVIAIGIFIIILLIIKSLKHPEKEDFFNKNLGKTKSSSNVFVKIPSKKSSGKAGNLIISAHLDSKSQTLRTYWRIILYEVWLFSGILFIISYISYTVLFLISDRNFYIEKIILWILFFLIAFSNLFLISLKTHNKSSGALDNSSGMAVVFELSSYFNDKPLNNFNLWFCLFSAEELGNFGSRFFLQNHKGHFVEGKVFQINLDAISSELEYIKSTGIFRRKKVSFPLRKYMHKAAEEERLNIHGFHLTTGVHLDSLPFRSNGFYAIDVCTWSARKYIHSKIDTLEKIDTQILSEAIIVVGKTIMMLDKDFDGKSFDIKEE